MINCPRCEQPVDETVRTTCPLCFTPLRSEADTAQAQTGVTLPAAMPGAGGVSGQALAMPLHQPAVPPSGVPVQPTALQPTAMPFNPASPQPLRGPNTRMTLNGDIIDTPPASASAPPMGSSHAPGPGVARPNYSAAARAETGTKSGVGATVAIVLALLLLLGGGSFGGYYWWTHRTSPKDSLTKYIAAFKAQDWKTIYDLTALNDEMKSKYTSAQDFADKTKMQMDSQPGAGQLVNNLLSSMKFEVQETKTNDGTTATVPLKVSMNVFGQNMDKTQDVTMKNVGGVWKVSPGNGAAGLGSMGFGGMGAGRGGGVNGR